MPARQPLPLAIPRLWLMTDARIADALARIIAAMPPRSAVVVRPYALGESASEQTLRTLRRIARAKRHLLLLAGRGDARGYDGRHGYNGCMKGRPVSVPVHDRREAARARRAKVAVLLVSPVFPTRSHAQAKPIGRRGFRMLAAHAGGRAIALGGMDAAQFRRLRFDGAHGWAGIDALARDQKRNWVPT
jgi:thiamine-phosphate pyrophosphorylase